MLDERGSKPWPAAPQRMEPVPTKVPGPHSLIPEACVVPTRDHTCPPMPCKQHCCKTDATDRSPCPTDMSLSHNSVPALLQLDAACSTPFLRSLNVLLSGACLLAVAAILRAQTEQQQQHQDKRRPQQPADPAVAARSEAGTVAQRRGGGGGGCEGGRGGTWAELLYTLALCCYPLHWFFAFLYYTDVGSLLFLLLCHLQVGRGWGWMCFV